MPEMKRNFTGGKMNKDLDERLVPKGEYRDAMNIQVSTSEASDVGAIENILGNTIGCAYDELNPNPIPLGSATVGSIADEKNDTLYWLVAGPDQLNSVNFPLAPNDTLSLKDLIMRTNPTQPSGCEPVFVDKHGWCVGITPSYANEFTNSITLSDSAWYSNITSGMYVEGFSGPTTTFGPTLVNSVGILNTIEPVSYQSGSITTSVIQNPNSITNIHIRMFDLIGCDPNATTSNYLHATPCVNYSGNQTGIPANGESQIFINSAFNGMVVGATLSNVVDGNGNEIYADGTTITNIQIVAICPNATCPPYTNSQNTGGLKIVLTLDQAIPTFYPDLAQGNSYPTLDNETPYSRFSATFTPPAVQTTVPNNTINVSPNSNQWLDEIYNILYDDSGNQTGAQLQIDNFYGGGSSWPANSCIDPDSMISTTDGVFNIVNCDDMATPQDALNFNPNYRPLSFYTFMQDGIEAVYLRDTINLASADTLCFTSEKVLEFNSLSGPKTITGINIVDDMLFWTDNFSEPRKINIPRSISGTDSQGDTHTTIINNTTSNTSSPIRKEHITVIRKGPKNALSMDLHSTRDPNLNYSGIITISNSALNNLQFSTLWGQVLTGGSLAHPYDFSSITTEPGSNTFTAVISTNLNNNPVFDLQDWRVGKKVVLKEFDINGTAPSIPISDYTIKGTIIPWDFTDVNGVLVDANSFVSTAPPNYAKVHIKVDSISRLPQQATTGTLQYGIDLFDEDEKLFEFKLPRFSYRYKYEDGEYSIFAPWTSVAFIPGSFDYHPKKGYNLGMTNSITEVHLENFITPDIPLDVVEIDLLYKEELSPSIYVVETIRADSEPTITDINGVKWNVWGKNKFLIDNENIKTILPSNQLLRPWDNVPKKALSQEVTGNRIVYGNYEQNYDLKVGGNQYNPVFSHALVPNISNIKSIKSLREYQLGVVFTDKYGRETPVISNNTGAFKVEKGQAINKNKLELKMSNSGIPLDMEYFKFYIKETSGEYYNMAMDRYWDAEDGNVWISFASTDRNKIDIDSFIILKKGVDSDELVKDPAKFKVIAIENEAPDFIKINKTIISNIEHKGPTTPAQDIFLTGNGILPTSGSKVFSLAYHSGTVDIYSNTTIKNLHKETSSVDGEIYFQIISNDGGSGSIPMKIAQIDVSDDQWQGPPSVTAKWNIVLDKPFGNDINQFTNSPGGTNPTVITPGNRAVFWRYKKENSPEFDGRFFVKVFSDDTFTKYIINNSVGDLGRYSHVKTQKIYSLDLQKHSAAWNGASGPLQFGSLDYTVTDTNSNNLIPQWDDYITATENIGTSIYATSIHPLSEAWRAHAAFFRGLNVHKANLSYENNNSSNPLYHMGYHGINMRKDSEQMDLHGTTGDQFDFEDVWFVDNETSIASFSLDAGWGVWPTQQPHPGVGITTFEMELGFGGIQPAVGGDNNIWQLSLLGFAGSQFEVPDQDFYNMEVNSNYTSNIPATAFAKLLDTDGTIFRWVDDPSRQVFVITTTDLFHMTRYEAQGSNAGGSEQYDAAIGNPSNTNTGVVVNGLQYVTSTYFRPENYSKNFKLTFADNNDPTALVNWNPYTPGVILGGLILTVTIDNVGMASGGNSVTILATQVADVSANAYGTFDVEIGMVWDYNNDGQSGAVIYDIVYGTGTTATIYFKQYDATAPAPTTPFPQINANGTINIYQYGMNGISRNSAKNINHWNATLPNFVGVDAVGYEIEILEAVPTEALFPRFPAVFETEPKDNTDLDIYYEISDNNPAVLNINTINSILPVGYMFDIQAEDTSIGNSGYLVQVGAVLAHTANGDGFTGSTYIGGINVVAGDKVIIRKANGDKIELEIVALASTTTSPIRTIYTLKSNLINQKLTSNWHNCYSFGNGVESNRIRDNFNQTYMANGVKVSTTFSEHYKQERRKYGLIYSGLYNSTSGVNNLNQFIQAEKITKDVNPTYGSVQKLHSRDSDLVALCEDKILRILANKDAVFNADGNTNLTATENVLGQTIPFSGEYGISKNPESFASESYRAYFTDKVRGTVMRLSKDGLTPISDAGMKDWFRDNLKLTNKLIGSYDDRKDQYNITLENTNTVTFKENVKGWVSFKSFLPENANSCANEYYTFKEGNLWKHHVEVIDPLTGLEINRNTFYGAGGHTPSSFNVILNEAPGTIKTFHTLNYEGSQSKIDQMLSYNTYDPLSWSGTFDAEGIPVYNTTTANNISDGNYYNLQPKLGWYVRDIHTDLERGAVPEFIEKEGKWFNYIKGKAFDLSTFGIDGFDNSDSSFQGLGNFSQSSIYEQLGCMDNTAINYNPNALTDDGSCIATVSGCMYPTASNYDSDANSNTFCTYSGCPDPNAINTFIPPFPIIDVVVNDSSCIYAILGCTDGSTYSPDGINYYLNYYNYDPAANTDDGSCANTILGCTDPTQFNYNVLANTDDGSCVPFIYGCTDVNASNYDLFCFPNCPNTDDGSCIYEGCTDPNATNYDPNATVDDGSCVIGCDPAGNVTITLDGGGNLGFMDAFWNINITGSTTSPLIQGGSTNTTYPVSFCMPTCPTSLTITLQSFVATGFNGNTLTITALDGTVIFQNTLATGDSGGNPQTFNLPCIPATAGYGCTDPTACNYDPNATIDDGSCNLGVLGCIDPMADNYDINATCDDGSCFYGISGCTNPTATNYDPSANIDDGSCIIPGCTDATANNYNPNATVDDGSCMVFTYISIPDDNFRDALVADINNNIVIGDFSGSNVILYSLVSVITTVVVDNASITSLSGLEYFASLTSLSCKNNQIPDFYSQTYITNILVHLPNLSILNASNNLLTSINVDSNINLTDLRINFNSITNLWMAFTQNGLLQHLECEDNLIAGLSVTGAVALTQLHCKNNQLSGIQFISGANPSLLGVDVRNNLIAPTIYGLNHLPNLMALYCSSNNLASLDVSQNTALTALRCNDNQLTSLDLRNGNNTNMSTFLDWTNNPSLADINVDSVTYANANWSAYKDASATYVL